MAGCRQKTIQISTRPFSCCFFGDGSTVICGTHRLRLTPSRLAVCGGPSFGTPPFPGTEPRLPIAYNLSATFAVGFEVFRGRFRFLSAHGLNAVSIGLLCMFFFMSLKVLSFLDPKEFMWCPFWVSCLFVPNRSGPPNASSQGLDAADDRSSRPKRTDERRRQTTRHRGDVVPVPVGSSPAPVRSSEGSFWYSSHVKTNKYICIYQQSQG